jgi:hypothetical protein
LQGKRLTSAIPFPYVDENNEVLTMSFESDVNEDVKANIRGHVRWYVEHYLPDPKVASYDPNVAKEQAGIRGEKIEREQSWWSQSSAGESGLSNRANTARPASHRFKEVGDFLACVFGVVNSDF